MRKTGPNGIELIKNFEGFSSVPYLCPAGYWTIGYGHVVRQENYIPYPISRDEAEILLQSDLMRFEAAVMRLIKVSITDRMFDALVSFSYNVGAGALQASTLRRKINRGEFLSAADQFPLWNKAGGRVLAGLTRRRLAERRLFLS